MHRFKSLTTARYRHGVKRSAWPPFPGRLWQRNYYEHVIRNEEDLFNTRRYIENNPLQWDEDEENPGRSSPGGVILLVGAQFIPPSGQRAQ